MEYRSQIPAEDIRKGCKIVSLRIQVERAIRRIKNFTILKGTLPFSMSRTANQIVQVRQCLVNFSQFLFLHHPNENSDTELRVEEEI